MSIEELSIATDKYYLLQICMFLIGWMSYSLYKLNKQNKPSKKQLATTEYNVRKANKLINKQQLNYVSTNRLKSDLNSALKTISSKNIVIKHKEQAIGILKSENEFLKNRIDNLVAELMKRQSYDNVEKSKFFKESTYPFATYTNNQEPDDEIESYKEFLKTQDYTGIKA